MNRTVVTQIISFLQGKPGITLDITGGSPEMNPHFRFLVEATERIVPRRIVRSNLAILTEPGMEWLPEFFARQKLTVIASLPCYQDDNVDRQRGTGVFGKCIKALTALNAHGYGERLELDLVYNPGGAFLPGNEQQLEATYRTELLGKHGITFNRLFTITNAPLGRFRETLENKGTLDQYIHTLADRFNPCAAGNIMCRSLVSVDYLGRLYNCDFNQTAGLTIRGENGNVLTIGNLDQATRVGAELHLAQHCYSCTAGAGSSCTGTLTG
jgi:radical SAM/Cys-rich protein